jgi:hypothetical protein
MEFRPWRTRGFAGPQPAGRWVNSPAWLGGPKLDRLFDTVNETVRSLSNTLRVVSRNRRAWARKL